MLETMKPLIEQMESDRETRAKIEVAQDRLVARLDKCEEMLGLSKSMAQPQFAEDLYNRLADLKVIQQQDIQSIQSNINENNLACDNINEK